MAGNAGLKFVDWEFASFGDPLWDVGSVLASYLTYWVDSMPLEDGSATEEAALHARHPVESMQPAIAAFWQAYTGPATSPGANSGATFLKAVRYCAARLLEVAYGETQVSQAVSSRALVLTQLSLNLLKQPAESTWEVLGVRLPVQREE
jgi:hypothetical protein